MTLVVFLVTLRSLLSKLRKLLVTTLLMIRHNNDNDFLKKNYEFLKKYEFLRKYVFLRKLLVFETFWIVLSNLMS